MSDGYKTTDGRVFSNQSDAQSHQDYVNSSMNYARIADMMRLKESAENTGKGNIIIKLFNEGNFDAVIKQINEDRKIDALWGNSSFTVQKIEAVVRAERDGDYEFAFRNTDYVWGGRQYTSKKDSESSQMAFNAGKRAWEKKHGKTMTEADFTGLLEKFIADKVAGKIPDTVMGKVVYSTTVPVWNIKEWERLTGKTLTKAEQIRIAGKVFVNNSSSDKGGGFFAKLFGK